MPGAKLAPSTSEAQAGMSIPALFITSYLRGLFSNEAEKIRQEQEKAGVRRVLPISELGCSMKQEENIRLQIVFGKSVEAFMFTV